MDQPSDFIRSTWKGELDLKTLKQLSAEQTHYSSIGLFMVYGSWNTSIAHQKARILELFDSLLAGTRENLEYHTGLVKVDCDETETIEECLNETLPCPPEQLPAVLLLLYRKSMKAPIYLYLSSLQALDILNYLRIPYKPVSDKTKEEFQQALSNFGMCPSIPPPTSLEDSSAALRIFVAGDRMSVGKTSVCLGILGNLVASGYPCENLAYIKPATQNESPQLVQKYCESMGIACVPIGPIVYYRGFTRAFLAGDAETSSQLLSKVEHSVDDLARGKHVVLIDGVGFPAVGSICGTDNATVARACGYPNKDGQRIPIGAVLVGGSGVGGAVDAFNLNANYFERAQVPVLGALFNKLSLKGFYSLENCKQQITSYFDQYQTSRQAFGFVPLHSGIASSSFDKAHVDDFVKVFGQHVNIRAIISAAQRIRDEPTVEPMDIIYTMESSTSNSTAPKRQKLQNGKFKPRSRQEIEGAAIQAGAAPSA